MVLLGLHPLYERHKFNWRNQFHWVGVIFAVLQIILSVYCLYKELNRPVAMVRNNILYGTAKIKQFTTFLLPLVGIAAKVFYKRSLANFWTHIEMFDFALRSSKHKEFSEIDKLYLKSLRRSQLSAILLVVMVAFHFVTGVLLTVLRKVQHSAFTIYYYNYFTMVLYCIIVDICDKFYAIDLRQDLLERSLNRICTEKWGSREPKAKRKKFLDYFRIIKDDKNL